MTEKSDRRLCYLTSTVDTSEYRVLLNLWVGLFLQIVSLSNGRWQDEMFTRLSKTKTKSSKANVKRMTSASMIPPVTILTFFNVIHLY
jgi:hypothetical protein